MGRRNKSRLTQNIKMFVNLSRICTDARADVDWNMIVYSMDLELHATSYSDFSTSVMENTPCSRSLFAVG